jgi:hypothetical protein
VKLEILPYCPSEWSLVKSKWRNEELSPWHQLLSVTSHTKYTSTTLSEITQKLCHQDTYPKSCPHTKTLSPRHLPQILPSHKNFATKTLTPNLARCHPTPRRLYELDHIPATQTHKQTVKAHLYWNFVSAKLNWTHVLSCLVLSCSVHCFHLVVWLWRKQNV